MAVIGGFFGGARGRCDGSALTEISRSTAICGGRREAFIKGRIGLSVGLSGVDEDSSGLYFLENGGEVFAAAVCGELRSSDPVGLLGEYARQKSLCDGAFSGSLSAAVCDGREELCIFRLGVDAPTLYYASLGGDIAFSSRIKGLIGFLGGCFVRAELLREHILSGAGAYCGEDLYCGVYGVERGCGLRFTPTGVSRFMLRDTPEKPCDMRAFPEGDLVCPDAEEMRGLLMRILFAFDYPQFDPFMPTFLRDAERGGIVTDHSLCMDVRYAEERRVRLLALCGKRALTVPPSTQSYGEYELRRMDEVLRSLLEEDESEAYALVLGQNWREILEKEKNTARRIRMSGMLWQTAFWYESYNVALI